MSYFFAVGIELFITIHMSLFVLWPLASIFNPDNIREKFLDMSFIRLIILLIIDLFFPAIAIVDFLAVFFGAFVVVPVAYGINGKRLVEVKRINNLNDQIVGKEYKNYTWKEVKDETESKDERIIVPMNIDDPSNDRVIK